MQSRPGHAPRLQSFRDFAARSGVTFLALGLLATVITCLIRADRIYEEDNADLRQPLRRATIGFQVLSRHGDALQTGALSGRPAADDDLLSIYDSSDFKRQLRAEAEEKKGKVSRLQSSLQQPLGPIGPNMPLCRPLNGSKTVAIVGNGPLSEADRMAIEVHDVVIRFNLMNNWQRFREKVDVWIMRHSKEAIAGYWGINNINKREASRILAQLKGTWLVGGNQTHADRLLNNHPEMEGHSPVLMPEAAMNKVFAVDMLHSPQSYPSTGFVGIQAVLHCTPPSVQLHIFGFNWSRKTWIGHNVAAEMFYVNRLKAKGRAVVHPTACGGMRECGNGDIDASCHWSSAGRFLCLRGKPRKWIDMTEWISDSRLQNFQVDVSQAQAPKP